MTIYTSVAANKRRSLALVAAFVAFIVLLGWVLDRAYDGSTGFLVLAFLISGIMTVVSFWGGDKIALWSTGAVPLKKEENPYVYRIVENLAMTAGLPTPAVYVIRDAAPNAFATGRDPQHASIAVTTGLVELLENEELEGVIAHELSHIGNFDTRFLMLVGVLVGAVMILSDLFLRSMWFGGAGRSRDNRGGGGILALVGLVLLILSPIIAQLIKLAVSRKREFLADASASLLTRYPEGLARALEKIAAYDRPMAKASNATAHLFINNPFGKKSGGITGLFSTHPPIAERIAALRQMGGERTS